MLNHIVMMGRLTHDPELRYAGETPVCTFRIASDRDFKNKDGEKDTDFVDVVAWRGTAENVSRKAAWPSSRAACRSAPGLTRRETSAAPLRSWPITCISLTPSRRRVMPLRPI